MSNPKILVVKNRGKPTEEILKEFEVGDYEPTSNAYNAQKAIQDAIDYAFTVGSDGVMLPGVRMDWCVSGKASG